MYTNIQQAHKASVSHDSEVMWKRAFDALGKEEADILSQYEGQRSEQNKILIDKTLREREIKQWTVELAGRSLKLRELGQNILSFIEYSQDYLRSATSSEPHATLAWSSVSLLLPLVLNQKGQSEAMMNGLDRVSYLMGLYMVWKELYLDDHNIDFRETVVKLYSSILAYQARLLNYLSKHSIVRGLRNAVKVDEWVTWLAEVNTWDERCSRFTTLIDVEKGRENWNQQYLQLSKLSKFSDQILAALVDIRELKLQRLSEKQESQRIELVRSLSSDYKRQKDNNPRRVPGTCEWFVKDKRFCEWRDSKDSQLLHVYAGPGCGKSVLARYLIDERLVATSNTTSVLYFFFKDGQEAQQKCENVIAAMLHQLYTEDSQKGMAVHAITKFEAHGAKVHTMFDELWEIFRTTLEDPAVGEIICVIDALDECLKQDRERLMQKTTEYFSNRNTAQQAGGRLKMLITSRPQGNIDNQYGPLRGNSAFIRLDGKEKDSLIAAEIDLVIDVKVLDCIPKVSKTAQEAIIKHLKGMENRTYLWLHLILDFIRDNIAGRGTEKKIKGLIERLPPTVNKAYQTMLSKSTDYEQAKSLLQIVIAAKRPLSMSEVQVALELTQGEYQSFRDIQRELESDEQFEDSLKDLCGLLLSVHDSRVYLIHQTARDFLTQTNFSLSNGESLWQGPISTMSAEVVASRICVSFLCLREFQDEPLWRRVNFRPSRIEKIVGPWIDDYTFLRYAAQYWVEHVQKGQDILDTSLLNKVVQICRTSLGSFWTWYPMYCARVKRNVSANQTSLTFPSRTGLDRIVDILIHEQADINAQGGKYRNALQAASRGGHEMVVKLLLDNRADANAQGGFYGNALQEASRCGHEMVVKLLLDNGADVNAQGGYHSNALLAASDGGYEAVVKLLLDNGADVNAQSGGEFGNALQRASCVGHQMIVKLLLDNGANTNAQGGSFGNALQAASAIGDETVVKLLLDNGADVNAQGGYYGNALQAASHRECEAVVKLLLDSGADVNAQGGHRYSNALLAASDGGHEMVVKLLLDNGADVNAQGDCHYSNALLAASNGGYKAVVKLLLNNGADINAQGGGYGNALQAASCCGHKMVVKLLLDNGANVNAQNSGEHGNALQAASAGGHEMVAKLLLDNRADANAQGGFYGNALQAASAGGHQAVVKLLLDNGANVNAQSSGEHGNALLAASAGGHQAVAKLLLDNEAVTNAQGGGFGNAL